MHKILVYGWYFKNNAGDDFFMDSFRELFPNFSFIFTDKINETYLKDVCAVFFGGGSFLDQSPVISKEALSLLNKHNIFYIGVGGETKIHPTHLDLLKKAKLVAFRESVAYNYTPDLIIPDLVYSLKNKVEKTDKNRKSILIIPNISVVPKWSDANWKHTSWNYFKSEFCQFLDTLLNDGYNIDFLSMCANSSLNDNYAAIEIINSLNNKCNLLKCDMNFSSYTKNISQYEKIITQRFHGGILAELLNIPFISISHHDKLSAFDNFISYYGLNKDNLLNKINNISTYKNKDNNFQILQDRVNELII